MATTDNFVKAFSFFSIYTELTNEELHQKWEAEGKQYSRFEFVDHTNKIKDIQLDNSKNEKVDHWDSLLSVDEETGFEEESFEVEITGFWTFEEFKDNYFKRLIEEINKNKNIIINSLINLYKDLNQPNKREIYLKTLLQIKGLHSRFESIKFANHELLEGCLLEIFVTTTNLFSIIYPETESNELFRPIYKLYGKSHIEVDKLPFDEEDKRIELKVSPEKARAFLSCLTNIPRDGFSPIIDKNDLDHFLRLNFKGFVFVEEERSLKLNIEKFPKNLIISLFWHFQHHCCKSTIYQYRLVEILKESFPNTFTGKVKSYTSNIKPRGDLKEEFNKRDILPPF